jgi:GrpB-like predicted nucleotidyltransferase (UPF0157 family)
MDDVRSLQLALSERVALVNHDSRWAALFEAERQRVLTAFPVTFCDIQHIGSTAVVGMPAKPIIDLLAGVSSSTDLDALQQRLQEVGYCAAPGEQPHERRWLLRHYYGRRTHHLHLVVHEGEEWQQKLRFRDLLRRDTNLAVQYAQLKGGLAYRFAADRDAYTAGKSLFIETALSGNAMPGAAR